MNTRAYSSPAESKKPAQHTGLADAISFPFSGPQALLMHQTLNELLHGIQGVHIYSQVGINKLALREVFDSLDAWIRGQKMNRNGLPIAGLNRTFSISNVRALRNAVEFVMLDLGQEEFFTRTGFSLQEAAALRERLNSALLDPLHIQESAQPMSY